MVYGIKGVLTKNIVLIGRGGISEPYVAGPHAVGLGWCFFGIGIGFLGNSLYRKIGCIACKVSGFVLGALAVIAGLSIILKN